MPIMQPKLSRADAAALVAQVGRWHHSFEIYPGVETPGVYNPEEIWRRLALPSSLSGQRVLDIGPSDGFYTKKVLEAGAEVVAVDYRAKSAHGFWVMEKCLGRDVEYHHVNFYGIPALDLGQFDIVLFLGVIYHLPDMALAMHIVRNLCRGICFVESHVETLGSEPLARYLPAKSLSNDITNFWAPNVACLEAMMTDVGIGLRRTETWGSRVLIEGVAQEDSYKYKLAYGLMG